MGNVNRGDSVDCRYCLFSLSTNSHHSSQSLPTHHQHTTYNAKMKAVVAGASGGIGQPLSLLLKACPLVGELALYDVVNTPGVTADLSHISSVAKIQGYLPADDGMKKAGKFNPKKLFGVTTLDVVRAETFVGEITGERDPSKTVIPVIGGHSGETIVPLFSQSKPAVKISDDKLDALVNRVQFGGDEVVKAKDGAGSATLSMAYAGFRFAEKVMKAAKGESGIVEPTFVYLPGVAGGDEVAKATGLEYFSVPVELGKDGVQKAVNIVKDANDYEKKLLQKCYDGLKGNISKGIEFVQNPPQ